jgi:hypothetical protein
MFLMAVREAKFRNEETYFPTGAILQMVFIISNERKLSRRRKEITSSVVREGTRKRLKYETRL